MKNYMQLSICIAALLLIFSSCKEEETIYTNSSRNATGNLEIGSKFTIKNSWKLGGLAPGTSDTTWFSAADGERLTMVSMLVLSNDWFFSLSEIELSTTINVGDISTVASTWDAGTEADNMSQFFPPNQGTANTGPVDSDNKLRSIKSTTPPGNYFNGTLTYNTTSSMYQLIRNNIHASSPMSPGVLVTYTDITGAGEANPLFTPDEPTSTEIERVAEDGNNDLLFTAIQ